MTDSAANPKETSSLSFHIRKTVKGGSWRIRGEQIAENLGAELNPTSYTFINVFVKDQPPEDFPPRSYLDVVDAAERISWLSHHPEIGIITTSQTGKDYLQKKLGRTDVVVIPHHHCNFERQIRTNDKLKIAGIQAWGKGNHPILDEISQRLAAIGVKLIVSNQYQTREDCVEFYKKLDVQLSWRPSFNGEGRNDGTARLRDGLKIWNAGSFGIPTVSFLEVAYEPFKEYFLSGSTIDELIGQVEKLKDPVLYNDLANRVQQKAEDYHIDKIAELYKQL